jgi:hypothetical protein
MAAGPDAQRQRRGLLALFRTKIQILTPLLVQKYKSTNTDTCEWQRVQILNGSAAGG